MMTAYLINVSTDTLSSCLRVVKTGLCFTDPSPKKETCFSEYEFDSKPTRTKVSLFFHVDMVSGERVAMRKP